MDLRLKVREKFSRWRHTLLSPSDSPGRTWWATVAQRLHLLYEFNDLGKPFRSVGWTVHLLSYFVWQYIYLAKNWPANHLNCIPASEEPCQEVQSSVPDCLGICWARHHRDQMTKTEFSFPLSVFIHENLIQCCKISKGWLEPWRACQIQSLFPFFFFWFKNK